MAMNPLSKLQIRVNQEQTVQERNRLLADVASLYEVIEGLVDENRGLRELVEQANGEELAGPAMLAQSWYGGPT